MSSIVVDIVSSSELLYSGEAKRVFAPGKMGEIGVLPKHTPFLSTLRSGEVRIETLAGENIYIYVSGGIVEVQPDTVTILSDTAIRSKDLDEKKALEAKQRAEDAIANSNADTDITHVKLLLAEAVEQLKIIKKLRNK